MNIKGCIWLAFLFFSAGSLQAASFTDNGDSTVSDNSTGLMWVNTETTTMTWEAALGYCEGLSLAGKTDWRLPNKNELESIVDETRATAPVIKIFYFPNTASAYYWTSTTYVGTTSAWLVDFTTNSSHFTNGPKTTSYYVRCVR